MYEQFLYTLKFNFINCAIWSDQIIDTSKSDFFANKKSARRPEQNGSRVLRLFYDKKKVFSDQTVYRHKFNVNC